MNTIAELDRFKATHPQTMWRVTHYYGDHPPEVQVTSYEPLAGVSTLVDDLEKAGVWFKSRTIVWPETAHCPDQGKLDGVIPTPEGDWPFLLTVFDKTREKPLPQAPKPDEKNRLPAVTMDV